MNRCLQPSQLAGHTARWLLLGALLVSPAAAAPRYAGRTLTEALLDLQAQGLKVLFTSQVVGPELRVDAEPTASSPRTVLDQLLAPHGLATREGPGGILVVVAAPARPASVRGQVRERGSGRPLAGVRVVIPGTALTALSDAAGSFVLPAVPPGAWTLEARRSGFVIEQLADVEVPTGRTAEVVFELQPAPLSADEIFVTPSAISLLRSEPVAAIALDRDEIDALPHLSDDLFRAVTLLPGTSGSELSSQFHIHGGRADEVLVLFDQLELFEPYHLRDFSNALSIVAPQAIAQVDLLIGGFPAQFGDRMGGVLDMRTGSSGGRVRRQLGLSVLSTQLSAAGSFDQQRGDWLGVGRFGSLELLADYLADEERPTYWDGFVKLEYQLAANHQLGARLLHAGDRLHFDRLDGRDFEQADTSYGSSYLWLTHQALLSPELFVDSVLSGGRLDRDRRALEQEAEDQLFRLHDQRVLDLAGLRQDWNLQASSGHYLRWGFDLRQLEADYDYVNVRQLDDPLAAVRSEPRAGTTEFRRRLRGEQVGLYVSDRLQLGQALTVELGLRYDQHTLTGDRDVSPRLNLVVALGAASTLRAAWGHFFQSQRVYELQVADGETDFFASERTEQVVVGFEHVFPRGLTLRLDAYRRDIRDPRPRYENLYEAVSSFPEVEPDRVRITPERSTSRGAGLFLQRRSAARLDWWLNYAYARVEDVIAGREVPRDIDQPHTLNLGASYRIRSPWTVSLAFRYHTGWPTTAISGRLQEDEEGEPELVPVLGPFNGDRLPVYHRLDLRASRQWQRQHGTLSLFLDLQNVYNRKNVGGFDITFDFEVPEEGPIELPVRAEPWGGFLPSFGIEWEF